MSFKNDRKTILSKFSTSKRITKKKILSHTSVEKLNQQLDFALKLNFEQNSVEQIWERVKTSQRKITQTLVIVQ